MPLSNYTILSLEIFCNLIYYKGIKYTVNIYNIPSKAYKKLPDRLIAL